MMQTPLLDRIADQFTVGDDCWEWHGYRANGYGRINVDTPNGRRPTLAHRIMYELFVGPVPDGLELDHLCRNSACVRPAHLEAVTHRENTRRGGAVITHCPRGHPYDEANTYVHNGSRYCRACNRERQRFMRKAR